MREIRYKTRVRRRRGTWEVSVPALPRDAPVVRTDKLANAAPELILSLAKYLGVSESMIGVDIEAPAKAERPSLRSRVSAATWQLGGGIAAVSGVYAAAGAAATLITAGLATVAVAALRESGRI